MKMHEKSADVQEQGCAALSAVSRNSGLLARVGDAGGISAIAAAFKAHQD
jgi:hypothetical protein